MTERLTRWSVATAALDALRSSPGLVGVQIENGWPGENAGPELIWIGEIVGQINYPRSSGQSRSHRDELFNIPVLIRVAINASQDVGRDRLEELLATVESTFADLNVSVFTAVEGLNELEVADPTSGVFDTPAGAYGFARIDITGQSYLT